MRIQFGAGFLFANPIAGSGGAPTASNAIEFATLQDVDVSIDGTMKELRGNLQFPDDVAVGDKKVTWKAGTGRFDIDAYNNLFFADTIVTGSNAGGTGVGGGVPIVNEAGTVPAVSTYTITVSKSSTFVSDLGVSYGATGQRLTKVSGGPTVGQYSVSAGTYTFAAADASAAVYISYRAYVATGRLLHIQGHVLGYSPNFELLLAEPYQELTTSVPNYLDLYACKCSKLTVPLKRSDYMISDLEGQAYLNSAGYLGEWYED